MKKNQSCKMRVWLLRVLAAVTPPAILLIPAVAKLQFAPAAVNVWGTFAIEALLVVVAWLGFTYVTGRFYCKVACPLGVLQDILGALSPRKNHPRPKRVWLRGSIALIAWGGFLGGWAMTLGLLEPFSIFSRMTVPINAHSVGVYGWVLSAVLLILFYGICLWKRRFFCTDICPVGSLLGLLAHLSPFGLNLDSAKCVKCGKCQNACPAGCIDINAAAAIDNSKCIRCLQCQSACPVAAIHFQRRVCAPKEAPASNGENNGDTPNAAAISRRRFLSGAGILAAGVAIGKGKVFATKSTAATDAANSSQALEHALATPILPPGAGSLQRLNSLCTKCLLCVQHCKGKVLQMPTPQRPYVHLSFTSEEHRHIGMCEFNCHTCSSICPAGAIRKISLAEKKRTRIGLLQFREAMCIAVQDHEHCGACAEHCPTGALTMKVDQHGVPIPNLDPALCIGCGNCEYACPVFAVRVMGVEPQVLAADPAIYLHKNQPAPQPPAKDVIQAEDDWPI